MFLFLLSACRSPFETIDFSAASRAEPNVHSFRYKKTGKIVFVEIDEHRSGQADTWQWVSTDPKRSDKSNILYREQISKPGNAVDTKSYYGPNNFRIVDLLDTNGDGVFETSIYYNWNAVPQVLTGTIARIESNLDGKKGVNLWIYPMVRMEIDTDEDGKPDRFTENEELIAEEYSKFVKGRRVSTTDFRNLNPDRSWALHPFLIPEGKNRGVVSGSFSSFP